MRITKISVKGLFGYLDHEIPLKQESRITIIHGPNGVGKTVLLSMLDGLFGLDYALFRMIPFNAFCVAFSSGEEITVSKDKHTKRLSFCCLDASGAKAKAYEPGSGPMLNFASRLYWERKDTWSAMDHRRKHEGKVFLDSLPMLRDIIYGKLPDWFTSVRSNIRTSIVHTQRLDRQGGLSIIGLIKVPFWFIFVVVAFVFEYFVLGQELFLVQLQAEMLVFKALIPIIVFGAVFVIALLCLYCIWWRFKQKNDSGALLLQKRLDDHNNDQQEQLFVELINSRLQSLSVERDEEKRFIVRGKAGNAVPEWSLSSGEKQLLHIYDHLLFEVEPNTLVLLDEPELSLHVTWQRNFLKDLQRIVELRKFDVLIATHSPQIVSDKRRWLVKLQYPQGEGE